MKNVLPPLPLGDTRRPIRLAAGSQAFALGRDLSALVTAALFTLLIIRGCCRQTAAKVFEKIHR